MPENLTKESFEELLSVLCAKLTAECQESAPFRKSPDFENRVRQVLQELVSAHELQVDFDPHPYGFPDIVLGKFGVEVKFTTNDTWRSVANSVFESHRDQGVEDVYVVFGKMGGTPQVDWDRYDACVIHVRTSLSRDLRFKSGPRNPCFRKSASPTRIFAVCPLSAE
ncbi:MAG: hypothetical protein Q8M07_11820 [Prosthecobacter sp.]|nr:hypothetical protein [Prosthecobacter sp.]